MRALFFYSVREAITPARPLDSFDSIHIGISSLAAVMKASGHECRLAVLCSETEAASLRTAAELLRAFSPEIAAFSAVSTQFPFISRAASLVARQSPQAYRVLGGMHATLAPQDAIEGPFNALCLGEGERPLVELAAQLGQGRQPAGIPNLWFAGDGSPPRRNPPREFLDDLDSLPMPDRDIWQPWIRDQQGTRHVVLPSRGCPFNCSYCSNHALRRVAPGRYVRFRSPANIVGEIRQLKGRYPALRDVYLQAETIAANPAWLNELATAIESLNRELDNPITYACNFRIARRFLDPRVFAALARANVRTLEIGLESGSERIRADVLRRHYTNRDFLDAVALARQHGMIVNVYNLIGIPGETPADHRETIDLNRQVCPERTNASIFHPYPGTDLYETCRRNGWLDPALDNASERRVATLDLPTFRRAEIQRSYDWFDYRVYRGNRSFLFRVRRLIRNKIEANRLALRLFLRLLPAWHAIRQKVTALGGRRK